MQAERIGMQRSAVLGNVVTPDRTSSETTLLPCETEVRMTTGGLRFFGYNN